jgi:medium-chain acyl-[acyl-carrier-protein] hydrolase
MLHVAATADRDAIRLFCVPHAGGGLSVFRGWQEQLSPKVGAVIVRLPGREGRFREDPYRGIDPLVSDLADAVLDSMKPGERFAFFGNSLGGLIAFETLHEIRRRTGHEALHLFVSAVGAPHLQPTLPPMSHLDDSDLVREVSLRYGGIPAQILNDQEFMAAMLPTLRADIGMLESYERTKPRPLSCPITAFGGIRDRTLPLAHLTGWVEQTTSSFTHVLLDEDHLYLQSARQELTAHIQNALLN